MSREAPSGPRQHGRRRRPIAIAAALVVGVAALALLRGPRPPGAGGGLVTTSPPPSPAATTGGYLVNIAELRARATRAKTGDQPEQAALADLLAWADQSVAGQPSPVEPLQITGTTGSFVDDSATAYGMALAWAVSNDERYALVARSFVMAWVERTRTLVGACPNGGECQTSLVVSRTAPGFVFAMDLLASSGVVTSADESAFRAWLRDVILPAASERINNWGDAGDFLRVVGTDYLGDSAGFAAAIGTWRSQLDRIAQDGHIPEEVRRGTAGLSYTQEALMYKVAVARIAERRGIDLWSQVGAGGGSLLSALNLTAKYFEQSGDWPWAQGVRVPDPAPMWELAYTHWPLPTFGAILAPARPLGWPGHSAVRWTTLTNGIPIGG